MSHIQIARVELQASSFKLRREGQQVQLLFWVPVFAIYRYSSTHHPDPVATSSQGSGWDRLPSSVSDALQDDLVDCRTGYQWPKTWSKSQTKSRSLLCNGSFPFLRHVILFFLKLPTFRRAVSRDCNALDWLALWTSWALNSLSFRMFPPSVCRCPRPPSLGHVWMTISPPS
jgi:hypothetical protein